MAFPLLPIRKLSGNVINTIKCFPFEFVFALAATWSAVILSSRYIYGYFNDDWYLRILMASAIGMPSSLAVSLFTLSKNFMQTWRLALKGTVAAVAISFFFIFKPDDYPQHMVHFVLLFIAMHLLVSFAAFTGTNDTSGFWQFNKIMFTRLLIGLLYSLTIGIGLSAAFAVIDSIFGINLDWAYMRCIWIVIFGGFNTLYFLTGIPQEIKFGEEITDYPKGLKFFSQYILIPLAAVYLAILLVYELKILIEWQLPKGLVSSLILGYAGLGMLALLLVYPIRNQEGNGWIKVYSRYFYLFLLPLIVLLMLAVTTRINSYGITQYRYFLMVIAGWLLLMIGYFIFYKNSTIKAIPVSLFVIIMLIIYGPQSATSVSLHSQQAVLYKLFKSKNLVRQNKIIRVDENKVNTFVAVRMANTLSYILKHYNFQAMQPLLEVDLRQQENKLTKSWKNESYNIPDPYGFNLYRTNWLMQYLGLTGYEYRQQYGEEQAAVELNTYYSVITKETVLAIKGYDYLMVKLPNVDTVSVETVAGYALKQRDGFRSNDDMMIIKIGQTEFNFSALELAKQVIQQNEKLKSYQDQSIPQGLDKRYIVPQNMLTLTQQKAGIKVMVQVKELNFDYTKKNGVRINSVTAYYFIKFKP
jgi:hypothetical protein